VFSMTPAALTPARCCPARDALHYKLAYYLINGMFLVIFTILIFR